MKFKKKGNIYIYRLKSIYSILIDSLLICMCEMRSTGLLPITLPYAGLHNGTVI